MRYKIVDFLAYIIWFTLYILVLKIILKNNPTIFLNKEF